MDEIVFGFPPLQQALELIAKLKEPQFELLREEVTGPNGFSRSFDRCKNLADKLQSDLETRDVFNILTSLQFLYDNSRTWEASGRSSHDALYEFLEFTGVNQTLGKSGSSFYQRLEQLIAVNPEIQRHRKIRRLKTGLVDTAVDFASFLDLRPIIADDRTTVGKLIPMAILRIAIKTEYGPDKSCVFQLSSEAIAKLRASLNDIEKKLAAVSADESLKSRIYLATVEDKDNGDI